MGAYVYKISTKPIGTFRGQDVYPSRFAYKPWTGWSREVEAVNHQQAFRSGCSALESAWRRKAERTGHRTVYVLFGRLVLALRPQGSFVDDDLTRDHVAGDITEMTIANLPHTNTWCPGWQQLLAACQQQAVA